MIGPLLLLNEVLTVLTLVRLGPTGFLMVKPHFDAEDLLAPLTLLWLQFTRFLVIPKLSHCCSVRAVLTLDRLVSSCLVLLSVCLGDNITALATLIVVAGTSDVVHSKLAYFNGSLTG